MGVIVDFHVHSTASDGTCSPSELVRRAAAGGFAAMALTDHDNTDGIAEFLDAARAKGLKALAGIELSIEPGDGFDKFHLLGLGIDPANVGLKVFLRRILQGRNERNARILENFRRLGIEMPGIEAYAHGEVLARPHFARWLLDHGYAKTIPEAFEKYLLQQSPAATRCYEERYHPSQAETFAVIHAAGGLCVMAHPKYWRQEWKVSGPDYVEAEKELYRLKAMGLDGLETLYAANTVEESVRFSQLADRVGLIKSAGSDFHGDNKPTISLGMKVPEKFIAFV